jgi:predicted hotdog family 3-hydroxylacyl-ACP dehydratase
MNIPVVDLLPHNPPMVFLDQIEAYREDFIHTSLCITENTSFFENGSVPAYVAIEYMAQTIAVWNGLIAREKNEKPKIGFLLGARRLVLDVPGFKLGDKLDVYGRPNYMDAGMAAFDCWIEIEGVCVAHAGLNVFQPDV